jgi:hypothetical protein
MKKILSFLIIMVLMTGAYFIFVVLPKQALLKKWHVEITIDVLNLRDTPEPWGEKLGEVKKGQIFEVLEINTEDPIRFWYKIKLKSNKTGWVANQRDTLGYLKDVNNPEDISRPSIKIFDNIYRVKKIEDINYDHLEIKDDKGIASVTHIVYHELVPKEEIDQYWIVYTAIDTAGKKTSKTQSIEFEVRPLKSQVTDFKLR